MSEKRAKEDRKVVFRRIHGRIVPILVGGGAGAAVAYKLREPLTGTRTVFHGSMNRMHPFEKQMEKGLGFSEKRMSAVEIGERYKRLIHARGIELPGFNKSRDPRLGSTRSLYYAQKGSRTGQIKMSAELMADNPGSNPFTKWKRVSFVSDKNTGKFDASGHKLKSFQIRMGEDQFQRDFVKEKSFGALDDHYHRPLSNEWYKHSKYEKSIPGVNRHELAVKQGIKRTAADVGDRLFPKLSWLDKHGIFTFGRTKLDVPGASPGREPFIMAHWRHKGLSKKSRLSGMASDLKGAGRALDPRNTSYEHAWFTSSRISPKHIVGSPRFKAPKLALSNIVANPRRFILAAGVVASSAALAGGITHALMGRKKK